MSNTSKTAKIIKRWYYSAAHWHLGDVVVGDITFLWLLLFSMCYSLHVAVNVCINCSFLHLFHVDGDSQLSVHDFPLVISANRVSSALYRFHDLALYWLQARDCNPCPSLHTCLSPAPLVRRSHVFALHGPTPPIDWPTATAGQGSSQQDRQPMDNDKVRTWRTCQF